MGRHQLRLLKFALRFPNEWHGYGTDQTTVQAVRALVNLGLLEKSEISRQFRLNLGSKESEQCAKQ